MRGCFLVLAVGVLACGGPTVPPCNGQGFGGSFGNDEAASLGAVATIGKRFEVAMAVVSLTACGTQRPADEVITEVLDPLNRKVEHTNSGIAPNSQSTTKISFTPTMLGSYHLSARFEPSVGTSQTDVQTAVDRSSAPAKTYALKIECAALEVMASGLVLCLTKTGSLRIYRDDALLQTLAANDFAIAGNVVWTTRSGTVERWVEQVGMPPLGSKVAIQIQDTSTGTLLARENDAILVTSQLTVKLRYTGVLAEVGRVWIAMGNRFVVHRNPELDRLLFVAHSNLGNDLAKTCTTPVPNPSMLPMCSTTNADVLGADSSGVWLHDTVGLQHTRLDADGGVVSAAMVLRGVPKRTSLSAHYESTPGFVLGTQGFVPLRGMNGISLEAYELEPGFVLMPSSSTSVRLQHPDGRQKLFAR